MSLTLILYWCGVLCLAVGCGRGGGTDSGARSGRAGGRPARQQQAINGLGRGGGQWIRQLRGGWQAVENKRCTLLSYRYTAVPVVVESASAHMCERYSKYVTWRDVVFLFISIHPLALSGSISWRACSSSACNVCTSWGAASSTTRRTCSKPINTLPTRSSKADNTATSGHTERQTGTDTTHAENDERAERGAGWLSAEVRERACALPSSTARGCFALIVSGRCVAVELTAVARSLCTCRRRCGVLHELQCVSEQQRQSVDAVQPPTVHPQVAQRDSDSGAEQATQTLLHRGQERERQVRPTTHRRGRQRVGAAAIGLRPSLRPIVSSSGACSLVVDVEQALLDVGRSTVVRHATEKRREDSADGR